MTILYFPDGTSTEQGSTADRATWWTCTTCGFRGPHVGTSDDGARRCMGSCGGKTSNPNVPRLEKPTPPAPAPAVGRPCVHPPGCESCSWCGFKAAPYTPAKSWTIATCSCGRRLRIGRGAEGAIATFVQGHVGVDHVVTVEWKGDASAALKEALRGSAEHPDTAKLAALVKAAEPFARAHRDCCACSVHGDDYECSNACGVTALRQALALARGDGR